MPDCDAARGDGVNFGSICAMMMSVVGTKLPIRDVRISVAVGGKPDMMPTAHFGRV